MKKKNKVNVRFIIFIAVVLLLIALIVFGITKIVGSGKAKDGYNEISKDEYIKIVKKEGYTINDITESLANYSYIKDAIMAVAKDSTYEIEYYRFEDEESAFDFMDNKIMAIAMLMGKDGKIEDVTNEEYSKYANETDEYYCVVFKIGNTVVCADVKTPTKDQVIKVLNELGYMN